MSGFSVPGNVPWKMASGNRGQGSYPVPILLSFLRLIGFMYIYSSLLYLIRRNPTTGEKVPTSGREPLTKGSMGKNPQGLQSEQCRRNRDGGQQKQQRHGQPGG